MRRGVAIRRFAADRPAAQEVDGRVDRRAPEIGGRPLSGLLLFASGQHAEEHGLQHVLRVGGVARDAVGRPADAGMVLLEDPAQLCRLGAHGRFSQGRQQGSLPG